MRNVVRTNAVHPDYFAYRSPMRRPDIVDALGIAVMSKVGF